jgi:hypothetical protein
VLLNLDEREREARASQRAVATRADVRVEGAVVVVALVLAFLDGEVEELQISPRSLWAASSM